MIEEPMSNAVMKKPKPSFLARMLEPFSGRQELEADKARLEAFLAAFPGEYCGFARDGSTAYSLGFCKILDIENVKSLADIQSQLAPGDAATLESFFTHLKSSGVSFTLNAKNFNDSKTFKISGSRGKALEREDHYHILWIEDITSQIEAFESTQNQKEEKEHELGQLHTAMNSIPRPLWLRDEDQKIIWCNATYGAFLNLETPQVIEQQKEIASQPVKSKQAGKEYAQPGASLARQALSEGMAQETKAHAVYQGSRLLIRISEIPLKPLNMTLGIAYNITREEELENELQNYQSSNKELLEQLRSAIGIYNAEQRLEFYNSSFSELWGLEGGWLNKAPKLGDVMEKLRETRRLPEQADFRRFKQSWLDMFTNLIDPYEDMLYLPDGSALRMLVVPHSMGGLMMTFEDVTSRLELESSYNTLIAVQKETLDNLAEAVAVYGGDGRLKLWNPAFGRLWNFNPEDLEGQPHITNIVNKKKPFFDGADWPVKREELIAKGLDRLLHEGRLERSDGTLVDFSTVPLPDGGVLITYSDVTDTVRVETALREKNAALETAERLKLDFLANVSYQLRTPLNAIMGFSEILEQEYFGPLNERQKDYTQDIHSASNRLLDLINDILDLSTLEAGYMSLERSEFKISDMVESVHDLVTEWARKEKIEIEIKCPKNIGTIVADQRRLQQALINLVRNAITYTPSGGTITIQTSRKKEGLQICVIDNGIGISQKDSRRIFEPFERAQSGAGSPRLSRSGAGLGLSLVKNIIALHGGTVDLESAPGKGTTVTLLLPLQSEKTNLKLPTKKKEPAIEKSN